MKVVRLAMLYAAILLLALLVTGLIGIGVAYLCTWLFAAKGSLR